MTDSFEVDLDQNGVMDAVGVDADGDSFPEQVFTVDPEGDTLVFSDGDGDQTYDTVGIDVGSDGTLDGFGTDTDGDSVVDSFTDANGTPVDSGGVPEDTTTPDTTVPDTTVPEPNSGTEPTVVSEEGFDSDGDGQNDGVIKELDTDGDAAVDRVEWSRDTDGDGSLDSRAIGADRDLDGDIDTVAFDADGNDVPETGVFDNDNNGTLDTAMHDYDQDAVFDEAEVDDDEDGNVDRIILPGQELILDEGGHVIDIEEAGVAPEEVDDGGANPEGDDPGQEPYEDPTDVGLPTDDGVPDGGADQPLIDPDTEMREDSDLWFQQSTSGFCAPASVAFIVGEYADTPITEEAFVERAMDLGYLTEMGDGTYDGMTAEQSEALLESFGVEASVEQGTMDSLDTLVDHGYNAIVHIDADDVWYGGEDDPRADGEDKMNHAVVVSEIKDGYVYLLDPGTEDGNLEKVPVEVFEQAWAASHNQMVIAENPDGDGPAPGVGTDVFNAPEQDLSDLATDGYGAAAEPGIFDGELASSNLVEVDSPSGTPGWDILGAGTGTVLIPVLITGAAVRAWYSRKN